MLRVVACEDARHEFALTLDEICRRGAKRMLAVALESEVDAYLERQGHCCVGRSQREVDRYARTRIRSGGPVR